MSKLDTRRDKAWLAMVLAIASALVAMIVICGVGFEMNSVAGGIAAFMILHTAVQLARWASYRKS